MKSTHPLSVCLVLGAFVAFSGCASRAVLTRCESEKRILAEQAHAQLAEIENLKIHKRNMEDRLLQTEQELTSLQEEVGLDRNQLADIRRQRAQLHERFVGLGNPSGRIPPEVRKRLEELSERYSSLHFDPLTGISKLETDILFASGQAELKPGAEQVLGELARVLQSPEAAELKMMVVGHTDNQQIAKKPARDIFPNNFHLSTARAHAVADLMCRQGFPRERIGVAGCGAHQPIAPNVSAGDRRKNRRVEIFVMNRDVPVVGWTDSMPSMY